MAKPNYAFEKRQKELAQKQKKEEKRLRKNTTDGQGTPDSVNGSQPAENPAPPADESNAAS
jgi:hypothetical protein